MSNKSFFRTFFNKIFINNCYCWLAAVCAAVISLIIAYCYDMIPFGDITILRMDMYHQYCPLFAELYEVFSVKDYLSVGDDGRGYRKQLHYGKGYRSLACAGLSDKAEGLSSFQVEADIVYCVDHAGIGLILY